MLSSRRQPGPPVFAEDALSLGFRRQVAIYKDWGHSAACPDQRVLTSSGAAVLLSHDPTVSPGPGLVLRLIMWMWGSARGSGTCRGKLRGDRAWEGASGPGPEGHPVWHVPTVGAQYVTRGARQAQPVRVMQPGPAGVTTCQRRYPGPKGLGAHSGLHGGQAAHLGESPHQNKSPQAPPGEKQLFSTRAPPTPPLPQAHRPFPPTTPPLLPPTWSGGQGAVVPNLWSLTFRVGSSSQAGRSTPRVGEPAGLSGDPLREPQGAQGPTDWEHWCPRLEGGPQVSQQEAPSGLATCTSPTRGGSHVLWPGV